MCGYDSIRFTVESSLGFYNVAVLRVQTSKFHVRTNVLRFYDDNSCFSGDETIAFMLFQVVVFATYRFFRIKRNYSVFKVRKLSVTVASCLLFAVLLNMLSLSKFKLYFNVSSKIIRILIYEFHVVLF